MAEALEVQIRADASAFTKGMNDAIASLNRLVGESKKASTATQGISKNMQTVATSMKAFGVGIAAAIGTQVLGSLQQLGAEFIRLAEAPSYGVPGVVFDPSSKGAQAYVAFAREMVERIGRM